MTSRTAALERIAAHLAAIDNLAPQMPSTALTSDFHSIAERLRELLALISDMPEAFDANSPWWSEWSAKASEERNRHRGG
jgi:hypothetical protein